MYSIIKSLKIRKNDLTSEEKKEEEQVEKRRKIEEEQLESKELETTKVEEDLKSQLESAIRAENYSEVAKFIEKSKDPTSIFWKRLKLKKISNHN